MQALKSAFLATREALSTPPTASSFLERGTLTPLEFERAGDVLVAAFPSWAWAPAEAGASRAEHPLSKQLLVTRRVPCLARVADSDEGRSRRASRGAADDDDGEWTKPRRGGAQEASHAGTADDAAGSSSEQLTDLSTVSVTRAATAAATAAPAAEDDDEYADLAAFVGSSLSRTSDPAAAAPPQPLLTPPTGLGGVVRGIRTYDVSITYDRHYAVPRLWLRGFDAAGAPLSPAQTLEDVSQDHVQRTATIEILPLLPSLGAHLSLHPCKHAAVMKNIFYALTSGGAAVEVDDYLLLFLKLGSTAVPTIRYDFTSSAKIGGVAR